MAQLVVPNAAQLRLIWSNGGSLYAINVLGVVNAGAIAITQTLANTIGTAVKAALSSTNQRNVLASAVSLATVGLRDIRSANNAEFLDVGAAVPGTGVTDLLPPQVALCITLRTAQAGQRFRGRVYLPGYCEAASGAAGTCLNVSEAVAFVTAIKSALTANGLDLGVIHRPTAAPLPVSAGFITTVTSILARDTVWDTQRRRAIPGI